MKSGRPRHFGRLDPYCWLAVVPALAVAALLFAMNAVWIGLAFVVVTGLILVVDSWANRPEPPADRRAPAPRPVRGGSAAVTRVQRTAMPNQGVGQRGRRNSGEAQQRARRPGRN